MFCAWLIRRWNFAYLHHIHTRESPSEYSERRYWSTLMYVVLKFLSCLQFQYQTAGIRKLLVRWCGLIFLHSYLGGVLKFFDIWLGLAASSNVKEFQYSSLVTVQEYPKLVIMLMGAFWKHPEELEFCSIHHHHRHRAHVFNCHSNCSLSNFPTQIQTYSTYLQFP